MDSKEKTKEQLAAELEEANMKLKASESVLQNLQAELERFKLYKYVLDQLPICTIIYDNTEKVVYRNNITKFIDGFEDGEMIGLSRDEYLKKLGLKPGSTVKMVFPQSEEGRFSNGIFRLTETTLLTREGILKDVLLIGNIIYNSEKKVIGACGSALDITEYVMRRNMGKKALEEQLMFVQKLIDTIPSPVFYKDVKGLYRGCNSAFEKLVGLPGEEIIGKRAHDISPREFADKYTEMDDALFREPGIQVYESFVIHADGTKRNVIFNKATYLDEKGKVEGTIGVINDITGYRRAEEAKRLSEERFVKAFNFNPAPMAIISRRDGRLINVNNAFLKSAGFNCEEILGRTLVDAGIYENHWCEDKVAKIIKEQGCVQNLEIKFQTRANESRYGLFSSEIIDLEGEECLLCVINDITDRKKLEIEMARLDRLDLIGQMAAGIGHEIRNPMTAVRGFLQVLAGKKNCVQYKEFFNLMIGELDRANFIITEFLSMARNKPRDLKRQNLNPIITAIQPLITANALNLNINMLFKLGNIPDLLMDEKEIRQLILNLARNGMEAMSPGGYLTIETYPGNGEVFLAVRDQGKGIDADMLDKIGTPFFTTKEQGTGLGLAVCYSIASRHNATISFETGLLGTTFYVCFRND